MFLKLHVVALLVSSIRTQDPAYWRKLAHDNINRYLNLEHNTHKARNIVLMIGDGMGMSTVTAARTLKGQLQGRTGEETELNFEKFPFSALSKTYSTDHQVPDSAATMTAIVTGVKTQSRTLGVDGMVSYKQCMDLTNHTLPNILQWSQSAGKSTGFVTTARVTHATPAALYAATTNRDWENDHDIPQSSEPHCTDIASQLVYNGGEIRVILGGGSRNFIPNNIPDPTTGRRDYYGQRYDGNNLLQTWKDDKQQRKLKHKVVHNTKQLQNVSSQDTDYLFGLFHKSHMSYESERDTSPTGEPSLAAMTRKAIEILDKNEQGYFLMIEGARIDHGHHEGRAKKALIDTLAFEEAVQTVIDMTNETDTLIIVTADHSHTMTISGYPERGNGILDIVKSNKGEVTLALDDLPYTTLSYANGPYNIHPRPNLFGIDTKRNTFAQNTAVHMSSETHSGEDVAIYSRGPMAHLLTGVKEQNVIAYVMAHAACVGVGDTGIPCETGRPSPVNSNQQNCATDITIQVSNFAASLSTTISMFVVTATICDYILFQRI